MSESTRTGGSETARKTCVVCGADCAGRPRVKDPRGNYYCRDCHDAKATSMHSRAAADPPEDAPAAPGDFADLASMAASTSAAPSALSVACPSCHAPLDSSAVICMRCGCDVRTGRTMRTKVAKTKAPKVRESAASAGGSAWELSMGAAATFGIAWIAASSDAVLQRAWGASTEGALSLSWGSVFTFAVVVGTIVAAIVWLVAPWWFRVRLRWSGGDADFAAARSAYFLTLAPYLLARLGEVAFTLSKYDSPANLLAGADVGLLLTTECMALGALAIGAIWLYRISVRQLGASGIGGALLLLVPPLGVYAVKLFLVLAIFSVAKAVENNPGLLEGLAMRPDLAHQVPIEPAPGLPYGFKRPRNWSALPDYDVVQSAGDVPAWNIEGPDNAAVWLYLFRSDAAPAQDLAEFIESSRSPELTYTPAGDVTSLGKFSGIGRKFRVSSAEGSAELVLFVVAMQNSWRLAIQTYVPSPDTYSSGQAVDSILESLELTPGQ